MGRSLAACIAALFTVSQMSAQPASPTRERLLESLGVARYSPVYRTAVEAFFAAQLAYRHQDYAAAGGILDTLWMLYPPGSGAWITALREAQEMARRDGVDYGTPPCYAALRMLTECVTWRLQGNTSGASGGNPIRMAVVLVGHSSGIQPTTRQELAEHSGRLVRNNIHPELLANGNEVIHQASWLFREYVLAMTGGRLPVEMQMVNLPDLDVPMRVVTNPGGQPALSAELAPGGLVRIWNAVSPELRAQTDMWWLLYPSHRPEDYPELASTDFSNGGGTTVGPDDLSFATFGDDLALLRKAPRYGKRPYTPEERTAYWAQLLQHEFFHHLFSRYPKFQLEARSHQWFDRRAWPADFEGQLEADYYAEALHKRLQTLADPPLYAALRVAVPEGVISKITPAMLAGSYRRSPVTNGWHEGRIVIEKAGLRWTNNANASWELTPDLGRLALRTGPGNPYYRNDPDGGAFEIVLRRGASGEYLPEVAGFKFLREFYEKR